MIGLGHTFMPHAADSSFPSDHLTLLWAVSVSFLMHQRLRLAGALLTTLGLPMAWARFTLVCISRWIWLARPWLPV